MGNQALEIEFWQWFEQNQARLFNFEDSQEEIFDELSDELKKVHPDLTFEFGREIEGTRDFVISAGGIKSAFPAVESLYSKAPALPKWKFYKFRQRGNLDFEIEFGGMRTSPKDIKFTLEPDNGKLGITVFVKNYKDDPDKIYANIVYLCLDHALGEYDVETKIGFIDIVPMTVQSHLTKQPFTELPQVFDRMYKTISH